MHNNYNIRLITPADAEAALAVYAPYVLHTAYTFEYEIPSVDDFRTKIEKITAQYPWLVCECDGEIVGYAYGSTHRERAAYQWSPESTVYISDKHHRKGIARILYNTLFALLQQQGYINVFASVLVTNVNSVEFHRAYGFEEIGLFKNIGYKLGEWHTNLWFQYTLQEHVIDPSVPIPITKLSNDEELKIIINKSAELLNT